MKRVPLEVNVVDKDGIEIYGDTPAVSPVVFKDGTVELEVDIFGSRTIFVRFPLADLVAYALVATREEE